MKKIRRLTAACIVCCLFAGQAVMAFPAGAFANGHPAGDEEPCAELRERVKKLEAEKAAREKKAAAAKKPVVKKTAASAKKTPVPVSGDITARPNPWASGRNLVEEGRVQEASEYLTQFLRAHPRSADAWYWLSRAYHAQGDYDRAQWAANIALEIDPGYPELSKTPSGLYPMPKQMEANVKEPRRSMSVLPVKQPLPAGLPLEPITPQFAGLEPSPRLPRGRTVAWNQREKFAEISRRRSGVDRMAILKDPRTPVAWKGEYPREVYFWTGSEWARIRGLGGAKREERADDILLRVQGDVAEALAQNSFNWRESDTPSLAACAAAMRYGWQGDIDLGAARERAREKAALDDSPLDGEAQEPSRESSR